MSKKRNDQKERALRELVTRFETSLDHHTTSFLSEEEFEDLLSYYFDSGDFDQTLAVADLAISQHAFTAEFYKWKALIHKINLEEREALETMERLSIYAPNDEEAQMLRLEIYTHFEKTAEAKDLLDRLYTTVEGDRKRSLLYFFQALVSLQEGDNESAWAALMEAIDLDPTQEPALDEALNATEFSYLRNSLGKTLRRLLDKDPFNHLVWYYLGVWYDDSGRDQAALDAFSNARSLYDRDARYELDYADKLYDLDHYAEARQAYDCYFNLPGAEGSYETFIRMGRCYQSLGELDKAKTVYFRAVNADPRMYDTYQHLGECFAAEGKWGRATHNYGRAVELPGHTADCWLGYALCLSALNEVEEAEHAYRKAIEMDERYSGAIVTFAIFLADTGREDEALALMYKTLETYEDGPLLYGMVALHLMCKQRAQALTYLNEALASYFQEREVLLEWYPHLSDDPDIQALFELHK